jgi:RNA polymerase sigma-70 factor (ECF subfamily)
MKNNNSNEESSITPENFREVVRTYSGYVFTIAYRLLGNRHDAEDTAQETFLKAYKWRGRYDPSRGMRNWLCTIALNTARDFYRKGKRVRVNEYQDESAGVSGPGNAVGDMEGRIDIERMLDSLDIRYRSVIVLFYMEQYSVKEISRIISKSESAVKVWLFRARKILLDKYGGSAL